MTESRVWDAGPKKRQVSIRFSKFRRAQNFADWLYQGFESFYSPQRSDYSNEKRPFTFASDFIGGRASLLDDLEMIFLHLTPLDKQELFRRGIGIALKRGAPRTAFPEEAVIDLIYLIHRTKADSALADLVTALTTGRPSRPSDWLQIQGLQVIQALLSDHRAKSALYTLISSRIFDFSRTYSVLTALCRRDPESWKDHFLRVSGRLDQLHEDAWDKGGAAYRKVLNAQSDFIRNFASAVSPELILSRMTPNHMSWKGNPEFSGAVDLLRQAFTSEAHEGYDFVPEPLITGAPPRGSNTPRYDQHIYLRVHFYPERKADRVLPYEIYQDFFVAKGIDMRRLPKFMSVDESDRLRGHYIGMFPKNHR